MSAARPIRYAIYTRQPVDQRADFSPCDAQFANCQTFADRGSKEEILRLGQKFDDEGESGGSLKRPALARLRALVRSGGVASASPRRTAWRADCTTSSRCLRNSSAPVSWSNWLRNSPHLTERRRN
jgi:hypothetical protein